MGCKMAARVKGVDVFYGDGGGIFMPESDPEGTKRPFIVVQENCPPATIEAMARKARERYDFYRNFDGYPPFQWE